MDRRRVRAARRVDFLSDPSLMLVYQVAEILGMSAEEVRGRFTAAELCEWAVYLNSPFSRQGRETLMNGWLVHIIRAIMADKNKKPKFVDSIFPFEKICKHFMDAIRAKTEPKQAEPSAPGKVRNSSEAAHMTQIWMRKYEKALADYKAGRKPNFYGLYIGETMRK